MHGTIYTCYEWLNMRVVMHLQQSDSADVELILLTLIEYHINKQLTKSKHQTTNVKV